MVPQAIKSAIPNTPIGRKAAQYHRQPACAQMEASDPQRGDQKFQQQVAHAASNTDQSTSRSRGAAVASSGSRTREARESPTRSTVVATASVSGRPAK